MPEPNEKLARLTDDFIRRIAEDPLGWPTRDNFVAFFRDKKGRRGSIEHLWPKLKQGKPVPVEVIVGLLEYLRERRNWKDVAIESACLADIAADEDDVLYDFRTLVNGLTEHFTDDDAMYLHDPHADPRLAARTIMAGVGRKSAAVGNPLDDDACLSRGSLAMGFPPDDYADWLGGLWKASSRTVMFAAHRPHKSATRVGVSVVLPLRAVAFDAIIRGNMREIDLSPSDIENPSDFLYVHSITEMPGDLPLRHVTAAQARCLMYQAAYFTREAKLSRVNVAVIITNPTNERRIGRQGYRRNGRVLLGTDKPIAVLSRPRISDEGFAGTLVPFEITRTILGLYRRVNRRAWLEEDRLK